MDLDEQKISHHYPEHIVIILLLIVTLVLFGFFMKTPASNLREGKFIIPTNAYYNASQGRASETQENIRVK